MMRRVAYLSLLSLPALVVGGLWLVSAQPSQLQLEPRPQPVAAQPQIVVHILTTSPASSRATTHPAQALVSPTARIRAAEIISTIVATPEPIEPTPAAEATATVIASEPTDAPTPAAMPTPSWLATPQTDATGDARVQLLDLHNLARAEVGLPAYSLSLPLQQAAQLQASYLVGKPATELMQLGPDGHRGPNGDTPAERAARFGYSGRRVSENWAYFNTVAEAFDFWLTDQWHRPQVLSSDFTEAGFGIGTNTEFGIVFVAVYGRQ